MTFACRAMAALGTELPRGGVVVAMILVTHQLIDTPYAFNIDVDSARVYQGPNDSFFGYTVQLLVNSTDKWLIIGSPKAESVHEPIVPSSGAIYRCSPERNDTCEQLRIDTTGNHANYRDRIGPYRDNKRDQWLGSSLALSDDENPRIVVCAPLWKNSLYKESYLTQGLCYEVIGDHIMQRRPLLDKKKQTIDGRSFYSYGMAGFSVTYAKGKSGDKAKLVLGGPGINSREGGVAVYQTGSRYTSDIQNLKSHQGYAGYSIASGRIYGTGKVSYVVGAPQFDHIGSILILDSRRFSIIDRRIGFQFGSYFGTSVAAVDFDGDGLDDIVVGAPLFSSDLPEVGRVYVFPNKGKEIGLSDAHVILDSPENAKARFGQVVSSIGDVNEDGYADLAVGAPYEDDNSGAIYIYNGGNDGVIPITSQRIAGKSVKADIKTFGWSISNGRDMDASGYVDFAVGSYLTDHVVLFRSRSVVKIDGKLTTIPSQLNPKLSPPIPIIVQLCLTYSGQHVTLNLTVNYTMGSDTVNKVTRKRLRAKFNTEKRETDVIAGVLVLQANLQTCHNVSALFRPGRDLLRPVQFDAAFALANNNNRSSDPSPILDVSQNTHLFAKNECGEDERCITDLQVRIAAVKLEDSSYLIIGKTTALVLRIQINNTAEPAHEALLTVELPPRVKYVGGGKDLGPVVYSPLSRTVTCDLGNPFAGGKHAELFIRVTLDDVSELSRQLQFKAAVSSTSEEINTYGDNHDSLTMVAVYDVELLFESESVPEQVTYDSLAKDTSAQLNVTQILTLKNAGPSLLPAAEVTVLVPVKYPDGSAEIIDPSTLHVLIWNDMSLKYHPISCLFSGTHMLPSGQLVKSDMTTSSSTLAPTTEPADGIGDEVTQIPDETYTIAQRLSQPQINTTTDGKLWSCRTHQCAVITCQFGQILVDDSVKINISLSVQQSVLATIKGGQTVRLETSVTIQRRSKPGFPELVNDDRHHTMIITTFYPSEPSKEEVALWIIIVSVVAVVLLLILIGIILARFGFFKRKKHAEVKDWKRKSGYSRRSKRTSSYRSSAANEPAPPEI